jgi:RNA polymerase sigma-70 factor (ECF subfamily)
MAWRDEIGRGPVALPTDQREAFLLKYVEGLNYEEMATLTGLGESALRMRVKRARDTPRGMAVPRRVGH